MLTWQFLYFLLIRITNLKTERFETWRFETLRFVGVPIDHLWHTVVFCHHEKSARGKGGISSGEFCHLYANGWSRRRHFKTSNTARTVYCRCRCTKIFLRPFPRCYENAKHVRIPEIPVAKPRSQALHSYLWKNNYASYIKCTTKLLKTEEEGCAAGWPLFTW